MKSGRKLYWTPERSLEALKALAEDLGRRPTAREIGTSECPDHRTFRKHFGSYSRALKLAGLLVRPKPVIAIDPKKAQAITDAKRKYWRSEGHGLAGWTHPYARRSA